MPIGQMTFEAQEKEIITLKRFRMFVWYTNYDHRISFFEILSENAVGDIIREENQKRFPDIISRITPTSIYKKIELMIYIDWRKYINVQPKLSGVKTGNVVRKFLIYDNNAGCTLRVHIMGDIAHLWSVGSNWRTHIEWYGRIEQYHGIDQINDGH